jgi:hypothetical protein
MCVFSVAGIADRGSRNASTLYIYGIADPGQHYVRFSDTQINVPDCAACSGFIHLSWHYLLRPLADADK